MANKLLCDSSSPAKRFQDLQVGTIFQVSANQTDAFIKILPTTSLHGGDFNAINLFNGARVMFDLQRKVPMTFNTLKLGNS